MCIGLCSYLCTILPFVHVLKYVSFGRILNSSVVTIGKTAIRDFLSCNLVAHNGNCPALASLHIAQGVSTSCVSVKLQLRGYARKECLFREKRRPFVVCSSYVEADISSHA